MSIRNNTADKPLLVSRSAAHSMIADALRLYVGRGRRYTVKQLSNATGVKDRAIECAMCDVDNTEWRALPFESIMSITKFLREDFGNEWTPLAELGCYDLPDPDETPPGDLAADSAEDAGKLMRLASVSDHSGAGEMRGIGARMVSRGMKLRSMAA